MTKVALFAAALLIGLPVASHAQTAAQPTTTTVGSGAGGVATTPKVVKKRTAKAKSPSGQFMRIERLLRVGAA